jgi:hypothetical protein
MYKMMLSIFCPNDESLLALLPLLRPCSSSNQGEEDDERIDKGKEHMIYLIGEKSVRI